MGTFVHGISSPLANQTQPFDKIMVESPMGSRFFTGHDDAGSLEIGWLIYRTGTTQKNDMTKGAALMGSTSLTGKMYTVELPQDDIHMPYDFGGDLSTVYSENDPILMREIRIGDRLWLKGSTLTVLEDQIVIPAANGVVSLIGDVDGTVIDEATHGFLSLGAMTSGTWMFGEYIGFHTHDKTA